MRINLSANTLSCQPLKNFGKAVRSQKNAPATTPTFSSGVVSREEYDKLNAKYYLLSRFSVLQLDQYNQLAAKYKALQK